MARCPKCLDKGYTTREETTFLVGYISCDCSRGKQFELQFCTPTINDITPRPKEPSHDTEK